MSVNKVILMGHTGNAPDFREFDNGGCVATFSLATTKRGYTTKDGRQIPERTEWHNVVLQNGLDNDLFLAMQESIETALEEAGIDNKATGALRSAVINYLSEEENKRSFEVYVKGSYSALWWREC